MTLSRSGLVAGVLIFALFAPSAAHAALTIEPITWNIVGLDSNDPLAGPNNFPVGARICSDVATTNVTAVWSWDTANAFIDLRSGSLSTINIASIGAGMCADAYFEVSVVKNAAAFDTTRRYHITATDFSGSVSTPAPRELYVEHLISQSRNSISDVKFGTTVLNAVSIAPGNSMNMVVGNTYVIQLFGGTATQGYNQFEKFINFPNTIFQILSVETSYSADDSPFVSNPSDKLYADACGWENDPNSPNYRSCTGGDFKAGGSSVVTTYTIRVVSGGGTSQTLGSLLYDFSGSSFHYNADFGTSARIANVIDPTTATISKSFSPNPASLNGVSALTFTLTNPNGGALSGYNFVDNLPANLVVATPPAATATGCGTPTLTANAGSSTISFSGGTVAANGTCVIKVNVTPAATGSLINTTNNLFIDAIDTGDNATDALTVNTAPPPGTGLCGQTLAQWTFPTGFSTTSPAPSSGSGSAAMGTPASPTTGTNSTTTADGTLSWRRNGGFDDTDGLTQPNTTLNDYFEFVVNSTGYTSLSISFDVSRTANGPDGIAVYSGTSAGNPETGTQDFNNPGLLTNTNWTTVTQALSTVNTSGNTYVRVYGYLANQTNPGADLSIDNVHITGCATAVQPAITKEFSPDPIAVNAVSTLTFTLTNTNTAALTGAAFTDSLPAGVQVAATPAAATTCGGTWAPTAGATSLTFSGGTIPASGSCTVSVDVTATTAGPHANTSGTLSTTESGTNISSVATDTLTALLPPVIAKQFDPSPILAGGTSTLTFTISNPNQNDALSSVAFTDTFPGSPGQMQVAPAPAASISNCGSPVFAPAAGSTSITFTGGTIAGGAICIVTVDVTVPVVGTYNNNSGNVSTVINGATVNGNTAGSSLVAEEASPSISMLKQVSTSASGPWTSFLAVTTGTPVFYRFTIENTGDVAFNPISITDDTLDVSACNSGFAATTLPAPVAANENHIVTCIVGPIATTSGLHTNTAHATGTFSGTPYDSEDSSATYATTGVTLDKTVAESTYLAPGNVLNYSYLVTSSGFAPLAGPVTVTDDKTTVTCPAVTTAGDLDNFLDPGESITCTAMYTIVAADVTSAFVTNTATATVDGVDSNSDSTTVFLATAADVSIVKTLLTAGPYTAGQSITYELFVANAGPATATNVQVTDTPANLTITLVSGGGCVALPCTIPSLAPGANTTITVNATITASGAFDNVANVTATEPDPDTSNNTDNTGNNGVTGASADVSIVKTLVTGGPYTIQQSITYTLFVANAGPSTATNVQVTDTPSNLTITNVSGGGCAALPCTILSLASGADATITVTATITAAGAFDNVASVTATETDPNTSNNTDNSGNGGTAAESADVSVTKALDTAGPYTAGQSVTYTITVSNAGPSTATNVQVSDTPSSLTITNVSGGCVALPCTIASLAPLANSVITVTATINASGVFNNVVTVTADQPDPGVSNNTDNTGNSGTAGASADVSIVKTLTTAGPFTAGQSITYTLFVANAGPSTATNVNVTDTPANLTITNVSGGCTSLPCTISSLASGADTTITVTATIVAAGAFDNVASATGTESDPNTANNTDNTANGGTAAASADVSIVKTLTTAGPFLAGQSITYTLFVANAGPSTATNVQVTDTPANLTITNVSGSGCAALPCTIASLATGANTTITVTATIVAAGAFDNVASANGAESDPNTSNNTDSTGNGGTASASADVSMVKTLTTAGPYTVGQSITWSLVVANAGPSTATNVQVTDTPENLTITNVSGGGCAALPCTLASLASGANTTITVTATIDSAGAFDNDASASATETDPNPSNNTDSTGNNGVTGASADVSLVKTLTTSGPFSPGQSITYTLFVANAGPSTATNVQVTDTPTNLTITNVSGSGCAALPCTIASLASGADTTITVTATIVAAGAFDNVAAANATETDPNPSNNSDSSGNGGTAVSADVSVDKTLTTARPYSAGQSISYTIIVANAGPSTATTVQVTDTPTNLTITGVSGGGCAALPCTIASIASGASVPLTVTATINATGAFDNSATAMAVETDPNLANNTDSSGNGGTTGAASVDLAITKTATTHVVSVGQPFDFTLVVTNNGPGTATGVTVNDPLPPNFALISATTTQGTCSGTTTVTCTIGTMLNGATVTITIRGSATGPGTMNNTATASANEAETVTANNTSSAAVAVAGNGPTVSEWGLILLLLVLAVAGMFAIRV